MLLLLWWGALLLALCCSGCFVWFRIRQCLAPARSVIVFVLGDVGRSPRMQLHALQFARAGFQVQLVGFAGRAPPTTVTQNANISLRYIAACPAFAFLPRLLSYAAKAVWLSVVSLCALLVSAAPSRVLVVQNPPALPTLVLCAVWRLLTGCTCIVDWHNYGFSILAMKFPSPNHIVVRFARLYEFWMGWLLSCRWPLLASPSYHLCVTKAMQADLASRNVCNPLVLYDKPQPIYGLVTEDACRELFSRLCQDPELDMAEYLPLSRAPALRGDTPSASSSSPALLVSSTSWTEDEDFGILLKALDLYDDSPIAALPRLLCVITGDGDCRPHYERLMKSRAWKRVHVRCLWLAADDYPVMLRAATLGVSLHISSSGLDLPMKVVDMFGCGLPVVAYNFPALEELVSAGTGCVFRTAEELAGHLTTLLHASSATQLCSMRASVESWRVLETWDSAWNRVVLRDIGLHRLES